MIKLTEIYDNQEQNIYINRSLISCIIEVKEETLVTMTTEPKL